MKDTKVEVNPNPNPREGWDAGREPGPTCPLVPRSQCRCVGVRGMTRPGIYEFSIWCRQDKLESCYEAMSVARGEAEGREVQWDGGV